MELSASLVRGIIHFLHQWVRSHMRSLLEMRSFLNRVSTHLESEFGSPKHLKNLPHVNFSSQPLLVFLKPDKRSQKAPSTKSHLLVQHELLRKLRQVVHNEWCQRFWSAVVKMRCWWTEMLISHEQQMEFSGLRWQMLGNRVLVPNESMFIKTSRKNLKI